MGEQALDLEITAPKLLQNIQARLVEVVRKPELDVDGIERNDILRAGVNDEVGLAQDTRFNPYSSTREDERYRCLYIRQVQGHLAEHVIEYSHLTGLLMEIARKEIGDYIGKGHLFGAVVNDIFYHDRSLLGR